MSLKIDWCSHKASKFACEKWHYSKSVPSSKSCNIGIWENGDFKGAVIFAYGANPNLAKSFDLQMTECYELARVAMREHDCFVSQVLARARKMIKIRYPTCRLLVSYADTYREHHGGIYQADNWLYLGRTADKFNYIFEGEIIQSRAYTGRLYGRGKMKLPDGAQKIKMPGKEKYVYPMDRQMRRILSASAMPYPK